MQIRGWKILHINNRDPVVSAAKPRRFHTGNAGQLNKAIWRSLDAEAPFFRVTRFEVGEVGGMYGINKNVVRMLQQSLVRAGPIFAKRLELLFVHGDFWIGKNKLALIFRDLNQQRRHYISPFADQHIVGAAGGGGIHDFKADFGGCKCSHDADLGKVKNLAGTEHDQFRF